jgi:dipeptidyl aminopeptidase/acylaminoacyl peptidase
LVHGSEDQVVEYQQSVKMCERLRQAGNTCELYTVQGGDHGMMNWEKTPAYKQKVVEWLTQVLHKQPRPLLIGEFGMSTARDPHHGVEEAL